MFGSLCKVSLDPFLELSTKTLIYTYIRCLSEISKTNEPISIPMRMLEIFCDHHLYNYKYDEIRKREVFFDIMEYMIKKGNLLIF